MQPRSTTVEGRPCNFWESGSGEPILYLHGFPTSGYLWRNVGGIVAAEYRVVAPDFPGFGRSELMERPHTWENLVGWLDSFVAGMDLGPIHLGVHDWGGLIEIAWACKNPHKVSSMLITDTSFRSTDRWHAAATQWRTPGVGEELFGEMTKEGFAALLSAFSQIPEDSVSEYWRGLDTKEKRFAKLDMYRSLDFEMFAPLEPLLDEVAPGRVRVVWGKNDPFLSAKIAHWFGERLTAEVTLIEGATHFLQEDAGEELGRLHLNFLKSSA